MSGTSLDGVDAVIMQANDSDWQVKGHVNVPFPIALRSQLYALNSPQENELDVACRAEIALTTCYANAYQRLLDAVKIKPEAIAAIGAHGQTIRHAIDAETPYTLQLLDGARLSYLTKQTVVCDFRRKDVAAGGQGAPLAPYFHQALFGHRLTGDEPMQSAAAMVNIGGISNISIFSINTENATAANFASPLGLPLGLPLGFDAGPGNALMDDWIALHQGKAYDHDGEWASQGQVLPELLARCLSDDYFSRPPPKSTGRDYFHLDWLTTYLQGNEAPVDVMRTLARLTAQSIVNALSDALPSALPGATGQLIASGGGAKNPLLLQELSHCLQSCGRQTKVTTTAVLGVDVQQVEAAGFAILASKTLSRQPIDTREMTGSASPVLLGAVYFSD